MPTDTVKLSFVSCVTDMQVFQERLLASPCLQRGGHALTIFHNVASAAAGFNAARKSAAPGSWLVWLHQDVFLPEGWDSLFIDALALAQQQFPKLAVSGVYGICGAGANSRRAGHVLDRGVLLREAAELPCVADSLDELLFAVRVDSGLELDPALRFDFYATDLVLQAQTKGWQCAVVDAYCEHWAQTPASGAVPQAMLQRILDSAQVFEKKWVQRLPITTPCFTIDRGGDVAACLSRIATKLP